MEIIGSSFDDIYLWNFETGNLLISIKEKNGKSCFLALWLWNNDNFFVGKWEIIYLVKIRKDKLNIIKKFSEHKQSIACIKKIIHPFYGECLISQDFNGIIKLWLNNHKLFKYYALIQWNDYKDTKEKIIN